MEKVGKSKIEPGHPFMVVDLSLCINLKSFAQEEIKRSSGTGWTDIQTFMGKT